MVADQPASRGTTEVRLAPGEEYREMYEAILDIGGAPSPVRAVLTTRRILLVPVEPLGGPSPERLAAPLPISLAGLGTRVEGAEVGLLSEDGIVRLQFPTRLKALAFELGVRATGAELPGSAA
ncbi:MAG: hypothetical protein L0216_19560 [Planctomycetales bacterium]|nr:hypothetical protein [Planctomycetales bacterium]